MNNKKIIITTLIFLYSMVNQVAIQAEAVHTQFIEKKYRYQTYAGLTYGYGATTWGYLIPPDDNIAMNLSTPISVTEGGTLWGFFLGYEFNPSFALEGSYMHYPKAKVYFDPISLFTFENNGLSGFTSHTQSLALLGKFMIQIPRNTDFRAYSSAGIAGIHRDDIITNEWAVGPNFGVGFTYLITERLMAEFGIVYTAGAGVSELTPADDFIPFLYSVFARLALRV